MKRLQLQTSLIRERKHSSHGSTGITIQDEPKNTSRHILIKLTKIKYKEKILKATREKQQITYKGNPIRLSVDFSAETVGQKGVAKYI